MIARAAATTTVSPEETTQTRAQKLRPRPSAFARGRADTMGRRERLAARLEALHAAERKAKRAGTQPRKAETLGEGMQQALAVAVAACGMSHGELAERSGYAKPTIAKVLSREHRMSLDCFAAIVLALPPAARSMAMAEVCSLLGGSFVPAWAAADADLAVRVLMLGTELGRVQEAAAKALEDGEVSDTERRHLRDRAASLASGIGALLSQLEG